MGIRSGFFDIAFEMFRGFNGTNLGSFRYGVYESNTPSDQSKDIEPQNLSVVYMCARILSGTISMMPINVVKDGRPYDKHEIQYNLKHRMSDYMNNQTFWSTIEYQRNIYGNSFIDKRNGKFNIIPINIVDDWDYKGQGGGLRYHFNWDLDSEGNKRRKVPRKAEWVAAKNVLHIKGMSADGVMGLPPVSAAMHNMKIMDKATSTISNFYDNRAMSPMSLESKVDTAAGAKVTLEGLKGFNAKYSGAVNAGKAIQLPPNTKLTPLQIHFADAELIATMKFTKDEICSMYGIPPFMYNSADTIQMDIEQQSLSFRQFTISPITSIYVSELKYKLLDREAVMSDVSIKFDTSVLVETDLNTMANAYGKMVQNGLISPNDASKKFGVDPSEAEAANYRFVQQQLMPLDIFTMHPAYQSMIGNGVDPSAGTKNQDKEKEEDK